MTKKDIEMLQKSWLFGVLSKAKLSALIEASNRVKLSPGKLIFSRGDPAKTVYVVLGGEISIEILSPDGRSVSLAVLKKGEIFGELAVLDDGTRSADARALEESQILSISKKTFLDLTSSEAVFSYAIIRELIGRLRTTDTQIENVSLRPLRARLAMQLIALFEDHEEVTDHILRITQASLAERLSATREKVNVNLQKLQRSGAVSLGRGKIELLNIDVLHDIAAE